MIGPDFHIYEFDKPVDLHPLVMNEDYGLQWPSMGGFETPQLVKELACVKLSRRFHDYAGVKDCFFHMMNAIRIIWPDYIEISAELSRKFSTTGKDETIFNTYFLNIIKCLCNSKAIMLSGPGSASKTFGVAAYMLVCYYCAPEQTLGMISTTSGTASESRIWGTIKDLHRQARMSEHGIKKSDLGRVIEYLKCITFQNDIPMTADDAELKGKQGRDLRNGIQVVPLADDSKGEQALETIIGRKNVYVIWAIDELPAMMQGVLRPRGNLNKNPFFQLIGIGNANERTDPHGSACEPVHGWRTPEVNATGTKVWKAKTCDVLYLDGDESPNDHPLINQDKIRETFDYPFPYISNRLAREEDAINYGNGNAEVGKLTIDYLRFAKGFWYEGGASNTVLSDDFVEAYHAHEPPLPFTYQGFHTYASLDSAWAADGDNNSASFAKCGMATNGKPQVEMDRESIHINPAIVKKAKDGDEDARVEYRMLVAREFVRLCKARNVLPQDSCMDTNGDGALMMECVIKEWKMMGIMPLSSLAPATNDAYADMVTEYWFAVRSVIQTGYVRGFNLDSNYARDLKERIYMSKGKGKSKVETKKEMKKRIHRSPDDGDSCSYLFWLILKKFPSIKSKVIDNQKPKKPKTEDELMDWRSTTKKDKGKFTKRRGYQFV